MSELRPPIPKYTIEGRVVDANGLLTGDRVSDVSCRDLPPFPPGALADELRAFFRGKDQ